MCQLLWYIVNYPPQDMKQSHHSETYFKSFLLRRNFGRKTGSGFWDVDWKSGASRPSLGACLFFSHCLARHSARSGQFSPKLFKQPFWRRASAKSWMLTVANLYWIFGGCRCFEWMRLEMRDQEVTDYSKSYTRRRLLLYFSCLWQLKRGWVCESFVSEQQAAVSERTRRGWG